MVTAVDREERKVREKHLQLRPPFFFISDQKLFLNSHGALALILTLILTLIE